ncbi:CocE/NonD family hydrolase [Bacillus mangrovi]|uniref:Xaa-Pro dipeptidyl-peptidase n=2 Tax=Metabacillus mangrovi TaxID=1491830 RepID=A0A7X2V5R3_9BACI|nr:Xaa-Pro dipeptidyl-peptidase [Metabacillus mangrovi]MTH54466.1 CocE/NonD family hydrolase [Metabacillus mangrovi]
MLMGAAPAADQKIRSAEVKNQPGAAALGANQQVQSIQVKDGMTQPVFKLDEAITETVFVEVPLDSDGDGKKDRVHADIIRPKETAAGLKVPVIYEMSPYRAGIRNVPVYNVDHELNAVKKGEGKSALQAPNAADLPGYYDNYFVPRGYAVVLAESIGTGKSTGCPTTGDYREILGTKAVIDWLNGTASAFDESGKKITADWTTGNVGMTGVSYNGTLPNAVAATGVKGLKTIVPIAAISSWYDYYRGNGAVTAPGGYPGEDADNMADAILTRENPEVCRPVIEELTEGQDRASGDYNKFWEGRDYARKAHNFRASVLMVHGLNDWNVKTKQFSQLWEKLGTYHVPRKLWLHQGGHSSPYSFRRDEWLLTLNKWFDYHLYDIKNDVMKGPMVDIQREDKSWHKEKDWPAKKTSDVKMYLSSGEAAGTGRLGLQAGSKERRNQSFTDNAAIHAENLVKEPSEHNPNRLVFTTTELKKPLRISGTPEISIKASINKPAANLTALLVDYSEDSSGKIVTRGWMDPQNIHSPGKSKALMPGKSYTFKWDMQPDDYVFEKGHKLGVVLISSDYDYTIRPEAGTEINVDLAKSHVTLPVKNGAKGF